MTILFLLFSFINLSFADLDLMKMENLSANYTKPYGKGEVEKVNIDFSSPLYGPYPVEIFRQENSFKVESPFVTFNWLKPWSFVHNAEHFSVNKLNVSFGKKDHSANMETFNFSLEKMGPFALNKVIASCRGNSTQERVENRVIDDCLKSAEVTVNELDVPVDFFISELVSNLSEQPLPESARPADNLKLTLKDGDFSFMVYTRVIFYAGLRAWGNVSLQNNRKSVVIRIDQIRFGYVPITAIVMKELAKRNRNPDVIINDRYIIVNF